MSDETTLLPCPFCGSANLAASCHSPFIICEDCGAFGPGSADSTHDEAIAAWNNRATHGTLTAERVQAVIFAHSSCAGRVDGKYFAEDIRMQAIANELNATLGGGECELVYGENDYGDDGWWCQSCGGWFAASFRHTGRNNIIKPRYCQQCGKEVVER